MPAAAFATGYVNARSRRLRARTVHLDVSQPLGALYFERDACARRVVVHHPLLNYRGLEPPVRP